MFFQSQKMNLECIRIVKKSDVNDIFICQDMNTAAGNLYTLLVIKDHMTTKKYLEVFEHAGLPAQDSYIESFSDKGVFCMVFEYKQERPLKDFYMGNSYSLSECEEVCIQVIMACIASILPFPIIFLILKQGQLHLSKDHSVYFSYQLDLSELDPEITERDCAVQCAAILRDMLAPKASQKAFSYRLLEKKISRKSYDRFMELYKDIRVTATPLKRGFLKKVKVWFVRNQDALFRILLVMCIMLAFAAVVLLVSQLLFGDIPLLRIFFNGFKTIGTESLIQ